MTFLKECSIILPTSIKKIILWFEDFNMSNINLVSNNDIIFKKREEKDRLSSSILCGT